MRRAEGADVAPDLIVSTTPAAWGETAIAELLRTFTPAKGSEDVQGPVGIAMASTVRSPTKRPLPENWSATSCARYSQRRPLFTVRRFSDQESWMNTPMSAFRFSW